MRYPHLLAAIAFIAPAPLLAQALTPAETRTIDALVAKTLADTGVPSASIAVVRGGKTVLAKAYGKQFEGQKGPADPTLPYQIASVSKQFTAAAIQLLADEGKLSLDDTVNKYIPGITGGDTITIRQLLSHTSGLRDYWPQDYSFKAMATPTTPQGIVDRWAKAPLDFAPGTQWQYSNTGYVVAGMIVEKVSGQPLLDFLQAHVFRRLGIRALDQDKAVGPGFPQGYLRHALGPVRVETPAAPGWLYAAGELAMSPQDLAKWDIARMNRTLLPAKLWAEQETPVNLTSGASTGYGLGVGIGVKDGRRIVEHSGEAVGFLTENIVYPEDKAAIVVAVNAWFADAPGRIAKGIADVILPQPQASNPDAAALDRTKQVYAQLQAGRLDRALLTEDAAYYFTPATIADYRTSLSPLGAPSKIEQVGQTRLRGGFVNRSYRVSYPTRTLRISTYAEPGAQGRIEQFLVSPVE
ncbi:serine hydrolase domain-containing protein [Sphingomonas pseudosanguinis]|uniref:CubicO group peptidase (Beta-lactamase class C family) n=1 Tax=Sphingomonas pseudosanguinis TaxID=413712 RepID=A0A7W6AA36_9SPHN|nr:serine hydrolase domain-containing protein [Sphingomonas pseudosanguinis]MBB3880009.1 CubicO group peptidase (beta-lactamase class C family) [Sphingomonas pseudosanguinis]MBN3536833.1 beta-lactamase family protein [Sphingomonas pseudosanguinis]